MISFIELSHFDVGGRSKGEDKMFKFYFLICKIRVSPLLYSEVWFLLPVRVENVIILVHGDSLAVKRDCSLKVASLTSWIALANFFKEQGFIFLPSGYSARILLKQRENVKWRRKGSMSHHQCYKISLQILLREKCILQIAQCPDLLFEFERGIYDLEVMS